MIRAGADIELGGKTPLQVACYYNHFELVDHLIACGANVNSRSLFNGETALHYAISDVNIVKLLIHHNADIEAESTQGLRPLDKAISARNLDSITELVENGAIIERDFKENINIQQTNKHTNSNKKQIDPIHQKIHQHHMMLINGNENQVNDTQSINLCDKHIQDLKHESSKISSRNSIQHHQCNEKRNSASTSKKLPSCFQRKTNELSSCDKKKVARLKQPNYDSQDDPYALNSNKNKRKLKNIENQSEERLKFKQRLSQMSETELNLAEKQMQLLKDYKKVSEEIKAKELAQKKQYQQKSNSTSKNNKQQIPTNSFSSYCVHNRKQSTDSSSLSMMQKGFSKLISKNKNANCLLDNNLTNSATDHPDTNMDPDMTNNMLVDLDKDLCNDDYYDEEENDNSDEDENQIEGLSSDSSAAFSRKQSLQENFFNNDRKILDTKKMNKKLKNLLVTNRTLKANLKRAINNCLSDDGQTSSSSRILTLERLSEEMKKIPSEYVEELKFSRQDEDNDSFYLCEKFEDDQSKFLKELSKQLDSENPLISKILSELPSTSEKLKRFNQKESQDNSQTYINDEDTDKESVFSLNDKEKNENSQSEDENDENLSDHEECLIENDDFTHNHITHKRKVLNLNCPSIENIFTEKEILNLTNLHKRSESNIGKNSTKLEEQLENDNENLRPIYLCDRSSQTMISASSNGYFRTLNKRPMMRSDVVNHLRKIPKIHESNASFSHASTQTNSIGKCFVSISQNSNYSTSNNETKFNDNKNSYKLSNDHNLDEAIDSVCNDENKRNSIDNLYNELKNKNESSSSSSKSSTNANKNETESAILEKMVKCNQEKGKSQGKDIKKMINQWVLEISNNENKPQDGASSISHDLAQASMLFVENEGKNSNYTVSTQFCKELLQDKSIKEFKNTGKFFINGNEIPANLLSPSSQSLQKKMRRFVKSSKRSINQTTTITEEHHTQISISSSALNDSNSSLDHLKFLESLPAEKYNQVLNQLSYNRSCPDKNNKKKTDHNLSKSHCRSRIQDDKEDELSHNHPLALACSEGDYELVKLLISRGIKIEYRDKIGLHQV